MRRGRSIWVLSAALFAALCSGCGSSVFSASPKSNVAATPVFTPAAGSYQGTQLVTVSDATAGSVLYYSVDGTAPTLASSVYAGPISVAASETIKVLATAVGYTSSSVATAAYQVSAIQAGAPVFSPGAGSYAAAQTVTITGATAGSSIYYTTDGTTPTSASTLYSAPVVIASSETLSAMAIATGYASSNVTSATYAIAAPVAAVPAFSPLPGSYTSAQSVTLSDGTVGASLYYTTDGSVPTTASALYSKPLNVTATETISAIAAAAGFTNSAVGVANYTLGTARLSAPVFSPLAGSYASAQSVTLSDATAGAAIYYTLDGSTPSADSTLYMAPIAVNSTEKVTAIAVFTGYENSAVSIASYQIGTAAAGYTFKNVQIVGGGFVDGIIMHPAQKGLMYARTDVGGAYRWNAAQSSWVPLLDYLTRNASNYMGVESVAVDPSDPNKLYLAVGSYAETFGTDGAILISDDQGNTFTTVPLSIKLGANDVGRFAGERLSVDPNLGSHLYFGSRLNGLWESLDSGSTWAESATFPVQGLASANPASTGGVIFEDFVKGSGAVGSKTPVVYVGVDDSTLAAMYVTADGGTTWAAVAGQPAGLFLNRGVFGPDGNLYLSYSNSLGPEGASGGSIWRYTPPAIVTRLGTWVNITPSPSFRSNPGTFGYGSVAVDPERPGVIMATTLDLYYLHDDVFRSLDGGNSWIDLGGNQARSTALSPWLTCACLPSIGNWLVSIVVDPYDSNHVLYGTGQTIWETTGAAAADGTVTTAGTTTAGVVPTSWSVGALGLEETVIRTLISPPAGAPLLSGMRDIGGFTHTVLDASSAAGMMAGLEFSDVTSLDFAQAVPLTIVRVGDELLSGAPSQFGGYSTDSGNTWTPFASEAGSTAGGGTVAISADGTTIVWSPEDAGPSFTKNFGSTWQTCAGAPTQQAVVADRINSKKFYVLNTGTGTLYRSTDGGASFAAVTSGLPGGSVLRASYAAEGDLWLASPSGLLRSVDSGVTFAAASAGMGPSVAYDVAFGKAASGGSYPAVYVYGKMAGVQGVFVSLDAGQTWNAVTDATHQYGYINVIAADANVFGRVYLGTSGRGIVYTDLAP